MFTPFLNLNDMKPRNGIKHLSKLIPLASDLTEFADYIEDTGMDEWCETVTHRNAIRISLGGLPNHFHEMVDEMKEGAKMHLEFIISDKVSRYIKMGLGYDQDQYDNWRLLFLNYVLTHWFDEEANFKLYLFHFASLSPVFLHKLDVNKKFFELGKHDTILNDYFEHMEIELTHAKRLVDKISLKGYNSDMFEVLIPHNFLSYVSVFDVVNHYMSKKDKVSKHRASQLIALYFSKETIALANKT